jgi:hypothetical protein
MPFLASYRKKSSYRAVSIRFYCSNPVSTLSVRQAYVHVLIFWHAIHVVHGCYPSWGFIVSSLSTPKVGFLVPSVRSSSSTCERRRKLRSLLSTGWEWFWVKPSVDFLPQLTLSFRRASAVATWDSLSVILAYRFHRRASAKFMPVAHLLPLCLLRAMLALLFVFSWNFQKTFLMACYFSSLIYP